VLLSHPRDDGLFEQITAHQTRLVDAGSRSLAAGRRAVRKCYPAADLYRQSGVLIDGHPTNVWFAYRDGRLSPDMRSGVSPETPSDDWWKGASVASTGVRPTGELVRANPEFRTLVGLPPTARLKEMLGDSLSPDLCHEMRRFARRLTERGEMSGALGVRLPWGQLLPVEFHARWRGERDADYQLELRSIDERDAATTRSASGLALRAASSGKRATLLAGGTRRVLAPGEGIGADLDRWAVLVVAGIVRLLVRADGVEPTLAYAGHGALLGSHLVPADAAIPIDFEAVTPSVVILLPAGQVADLIGAEGPFAQAVVRQAQTLVGSTAMTLAARTAADLPQRLAREIALLSELYPSRRLIPVTEQQLADGVGSIRESVARSLGAFRRSGWIATTSHGLIVLDEKELRANAHLGLLPVGGLVSGIN
jgi:CRP-like cAMP-binding protein